MILNLVPLIENISAGWVAVFLVFLRVGAVMALLPGFGEQLVPMRIRLGLTVAFTIIVAPAAPVPTGALASTAEGILMAALAEVVAGLALGIAFRLMVVALQVGGAIAANVTSLSQLFGGTAADPQPALGNLMVIGGLAVAMIAGLHVKVAVALVLSYDLFPPGQLIEARVIADWGQERVSQAFALGFSLAAPFVISSLIYNLALGAINRAMPQLMVAFVGAPAITAGGLILMFLTLPILLGLWMNAFDAVLSDPGGTG